MYIGLQNTIEYGSITLFDTNNGWVVSDKTATVTIDGRNFDSQITQEQLNKLVEKGLILGINRKINTKLKYSKPVETSLAVDDIIGLFEPVYNPNYRPDRGGEE